MNEAYLGEYFREVSSEEFYKVLYSYEEDIVRHMSLEKGCYDAEWRFRQTGEVFGHHKVTHKVNVEFRYFLHNDVCKEE